tara:strand:- start:92 stop:553 length:462 start_codon:yes stop_codon:yes gene_type:complete
MPRPSRRELGKKMFPELTKPGGSKGDKEASLKINVMAIELILVDAIKMYDEGFDKHGPGALFYPLTKLKPHREKEGKYYLSLDDLKAGAAETDAAGDEFNHAFLSSLVDTVVQFNPAKAALVVLVDKTGMSTKIIEREYPAKHAQAILEEMSK